MRTPKGTENVSIEAAVISVWIVMLGHAQSQLIPLFISLLAGPKQALPPRDDLLARIKPSLKQAVQLISAVEVLKGFLNNRSAKSAVAFLYIVFRYMQHGEKEPTRQQSIQLWDSVWEKAKEFPLVAEEWKAEEERGDLKGWKADVQDSARRQLRTFKRQLPRIERNSAFIYSKVFARLFGDDVSVA